MSRDTLTLKKFDSGIITQVHQEDSPLEAYIWGKDIDPETTDGRVRGIEDLGTDITVGDKARISAFIENDGVYDLILHNSADNKISAVIDFYNSTGLRKEIDIFTSGVDDASTILINNKEAHIGIGNARDPKWAGYVSQGIFGYGLTWTVSGCANNGAGLIRVSTSTEHSLSNGDLVKISGVTGTTEANGVWMVSNTYNWDAGGTDAYFDLVGSTFANAYTAGGTATQHLVLENDYLNTPTGTSDGGISITSLTDTVGSGTDKYFLTTKGYMWAWSAVFDGYQEGNLRLFSGTTADIPAANSSYYTIVLTAYGATPATGNHSGLGSFNKRITGINIYRAEGSPLEGIGGLGLFKLIKFIDMNDGSWTTATNDKTYTFNDYGASLLTTYEENTGITEAFGRTYSSYVDYALSVKGNGYAFYGNCYNTSITDGNRYIFRSKYYRFSMVDWSQDFLIMPRPLTAMTFYEGRLYVFDLNNTYRINPETMAIEDVFEGIGASGQRSVCLTPYGMFIANINGAYHFDGNFTEISLPIKNLGFTGTGVSPTNMYWGKFGLDLGLEIMAVYSSEKECVIFANTITISATIYLMAWVWNIPRKRWDFWDYGEADVSTGFITGEDGELYLSESTLGTRQLYQGSRKLFTFVTKEFDFNNPNQDKSINMIKWDGSLLTVKYAFNGSDASAGTSATSGAYLNQYKRTVQLYVSASDAASYLDSLDIVYRQKVGYR